MPWAYVKVAEGCDKACGFCAIPSLPRAPTLAHHRPVLDEVDSLAAGGVQEVVLVAQDLASYGRDQGVGTKDLVPLVERSRRGCRGCGSSTSTRPTSTIGSSTR